MENLLENETSNTLRNEKYSASFRSFFKFTFALLAMSVLAGCGGGGGGDSDGDSSGIADVPANDGTPPVTPDPVAPDPIVLETPLSQLYGRTIFTFFFTENEGQMFAFDASFGPEDLIDDGFGNLLLADTVVASLSESPGSAFVAAQEPELMTCLFDDEGERFSCRVVFVGQGGASANFDFALRDDNRDSTGSFTFCPSDQDTGLCIRQGLFTPDGWVTVEVFSLSLTSSTNLIQLDDAKNSPNGASILPYLQYGNQGSFGSTVNRL